MLLDSVSAAGRQSVSMQRKLMLYLLCLVLAAFVFLLMLLPSGEASVFTVASRKK